MIVVLVGRKKGHEIDGLVNGKELNLDTLFEGSINFLENQKCKEHSIFGKWGIER
jgi:hypothetical protein